MDIIMKRRIFFYFFDKKGSLITRQMIIHLGMILILVLVYILLGGYVDSIKNDAQFEMTFLSRDLALLANTLYSAPGDIEYKYSFEKKDLNTFIFEFGQLDAANDMQLVKVSGYEQKKYYPYGKNQEDKSTQTIQNTNSIKLTKYGTKLSIKNE